MSQATISIFGRLTKDGEVKSIQTKNGPKDVLEINVAADFFKSGKKEGIFFRCTSFNQRHADLRTKFGALNKGNTVFVSGRLGMHKYNGASGPGVSLEVDVFEIDLAGKNEDTGNTGGQAQPQQAAAPVAQAQPQQAQPVAQAPAQPATGNGQEFF